MLRTVRAAIVKVRAQGVDQLSALIDQLFAGAKHNRPGLLLLALGEAHRWPLRRLDDRLRIRCVVLMPLDERFDIARGNQFRLMAKPGHLARPVVGTAARLHRHDTCRMTRHEPTKLQARQLLAEYNRSISCRPVQLKGVLCQIDPDDGNLFHGCLPLLCMV